MEATQMTNEVQIKKTDWAGHEVWIYEVNGKTSVKMYQTKEAATLAASQAVRP